MRTIAHISDIHFGRVDDAVAEGLVKDLADHPYDLLVMSGDFTQRARESQYASAAEYMKRFPGPQLVVPGYHAIPLYDLVRRFLFPLSRYRRLITKDLRPFHYDDGHLAVLGINTARPWTWSWDGFWKDGHISEEQLLDVKLRMCELPPTCFKIVVTHHPFIPPPGERVHGIVHGAKRALDMMESCGVDMLIEIGRAHV